MGLVDKGDDTTKGGDITNARVWCHHTFISCPDTPPTGQFWRSEVQGNVQVLQNTPMTDRGVNSDSLQIKNSDGLDVM